MTIDQTKVTRTRAAIAAGTYLTDARLDIAAGRVLDVLRVEDVEEAERAAVLSRDDRFEMF